MDKIHILVADDHAVVREGLRMLISSDPDMELVGEAADGEDAIRKAHILNRMLSSWIWLCRARMARKQSRRLKKNSPKYVSWS